MDVAGILLAAGSATRMGRNKLLLDVGGEPLLRRAARRGLAAGLDPLLVVLGHEAELAEAALTGLACRLLRNPDHARGMNGSLALGVAAVPASAEAAVVLLADMPLVDAAMISALVGRWRESGAPLATAVYGEVTAPPTLYARSLFPELSVREGEGRGREVVRRNLDRAALVPFPPSSLSDVDAPGDLERARQVAQASGGEA
jgi:molybdenum cofactor cytidylyltransferase